jgi:hypothetical protein
MIRTLEKIPPWVKVLDHKVQSATRLALRECFEGSINSNMNSALGQRCKDDTCDAMKYDTTRLLPCEILQAWRR